MKDFLPPHWQGKGVCEQGKHMAGALSLDVSGSAGTVDEVRVVLSKLPDREQTTELMI